MRRIKILSAVSTALTGLLASGYAFAQGLTYPTKPAGIPGDTFNTLSQVIGTYINVFLVAVGILTVGFLIYGGIQYITSAGNEEQAEAGKKTITNSIIGLVIIILSYVIVTVIFNAIARQQA